MLTNDQVARYWEDGFIQGIDVLTAEQTAHYRNRFEAIEAREVSAHGGAWVNRDYLPWERKDHPFRELFAELAREPALLDAVESILGPDLLIRNGDVFIKGTSGDTGISWHIDVAHADGTSDQLLTAWLGLGEEPVEARTGAMRFYRGGHRITLPDPPVDRFDLNLSDRAKALIPPSEIEYTSMKPGQLSLHHACTPHASGANRGRANRIGFVLRFISPRASEKLADCGMATRVRGSKSGPFGERESFPVTWRHRGPEPEPGPSREGSRGIARLMRRARSTWRRF